jgi:hypothetical protein
MDDEIYVVKIIVIVFSQSVRNNFKREERAVRRNKECGENYLKKFYSRNDEKYFIVNNFIQHLFIMKS